MTLADTIAGIATQYYKVACLELVTCSIFTSKEPSPDQVLLELELQIRHEHPRILLTYNNKCLYYFRFGHWASPSEADEAARSDKNNPDLQLDAVYPQLALKFEISVAVEKLANPTQASRSKPPSTVKEDHAKDEYLACASLSFMKAVKKTLVYNMSALGEMFLFGNYVVCRIAANSSQFRVVQIDPVLLGNGDLLVLITQRDRLLLFHSSVLDLDHVAPEFSKCFAIYVIPSGLRCHLYDSHNWRQSFTTTPPRSSDNLLRLLKSSTGVDLTSKPLILWVKLIPNLQHLNNQTSDISRFIHDVDNRKYILWPWELCVLQFGSVEKTKTTTGRACVADPLALINEYMSYSISLRDGDSPMKYRTMTTCANALNANTDTHIQSTAPNFTPDSAAYPTNVFSAPPVRVSFGEADAVLPQTSPLTGNASITGIFDLGNDVLDGDRLLETGNLNETQEHPMMEDERLEEAGDGANDDDADLFGESSDLELEEIDPHPEGVKLDDKLHLVAEVKSVSSQEPETSKSEKYTCSDVLVDTANLSKASNDAELRSQVSPMKEKPTLGNSTEPASYMGIPRSEMITAEIRQFTPGSYVDPGAPLPVIPTPAFPPASIFSAGPQAPVPSLTLQQGHPSQPFNPMSKHATPVYKRDRRQLEPATGWAFSPIAFNPRIKSSIDTKYGKGGKFYVDTEDSSGPDLEPRKSRIREPSVQAYDLHVPEEALNLKSGRIHESTSSVGAGDTKTQIPFNSTAKYRPEVDLPASYREIVLGEDGGLAILSDEAHNDAEDDDFEEEDDEIEDGDEEMDEDESDEDEEPPLSDANNESLRLNPHSGDLFQSMVRGESLQETRLVPSSVASLRHAVSGSTSALISPGPIQPKGSRHMPDLSPFGLCIDALGFSISPLPALELKSGTSSGVVPSVLGDVSINSELQVVNKELIETSNIPSSSTSSSGDVSESSNCLPLILRSINVHSIPSIFLLNKVPGSWGEVSMARGFDMEVDEEGDDIDQKDDGLFAISVHMDELLSSLVPNIVYDSGFTNFERLTQLNLPDFFSEDASADTTEDGASAETARILSSTFPLSYNVSLGEILQENPVALSTLDASNPEMTNEIPFLRDMTMDMNTDHVELTLAEAELPHVHWDSFHLSSFVSSDRQSKLKRSSDFITLSSDTIVDQNSLFAFDDVKVKARRNQADIINLNLLGSRFWKYFSFDPVNGPKSFQMLMLTTSHPQHENVLTSNSAPAEFLDLVKYNYAGLRFGNIKKLNLPKFETRPDLDGVSNGTLAIAKCIGKASQNDWYKRANRMLKNLAELIKLDIINRTNRFEFDRPLLLLFIDFDESINSILQISKLCRNFKVSFKNHQLSLVEVFAHVIPSSDIFRKSQSGHCLKYLSDTKLTKISTILYNKCPSTNLADSKVATHDEDEPKKLFTQLVKDPPTFKFFNRQSKDSFSHESHDDTFLHVAYERSVDKNWICAAWSDPLGIVTHIKSWYCPPATKDGLDKDVHDLGSIIFKIWEISNKLFKRLHEDILQRVSGSGRKKFLVLARINSIIPDDELLYWKRLTAKFKDVSLIALTTNRAPMHLFGHLGSEGDTACVPFKDNADLLCSNNIKAADKDEKQGPISETADFMQSLEALPMNHNSTSPSGSFAMSNSPMNNPFSFHSPQQFLNVPSNMFLPQESRLDQGLKDADCTLKDASLEVVGIIPKIALPSCNSATRYGMRTGYLAKRAARSTAAARSGYIIFEVSLLSCSNHWNLDMVMKITLKQFKKLIALNDILGICDQTVASSNDLSKSGGGLELQTLVPWHINAVVKALDYLVHVHVGE